MRPQLVTPATSTHTLELHRLRAERARYIAHAVRRVLAEEDLAGEVEVQDRGGSWSIVARAVGSRDVVVPAMAALFERFGLSR